MCVCVCSHSPIGAVPERGELGEADGLDVDVSLSVEPSSSVPQLDGVDLTQDHGVSQHSPVHCCICLTVIHTHTCIYTHRVHVNNVVITTQDQPDRTTFR